MINPSPDLLGMLITQSNENDEEFIRGLTDFDTWTKRAQEVNARMGVFGLQMTARPWENGHRQGF